MDITNRIVKTEPIEWRGLTWLQNSSLKEMTKDSFERLKTSLKKNMFIMPFNCWQNGKKTYILDGHHRQKALEALEKEGASIPDFLPANFIDCKDRKEAVKLVLVYSSIYANVTSDGLYEFLSIEDLDFGELKDELDLPEIDLKSFEQGYFGEEPADAEPQIDRAEELNKKWQVQTGDLWQVGEHRLLCGDSTKKEDVERVMGGKKAGACVTDSPYGINRKGIENDDPKGLRDLFNGVLGNMPIENGVIINFQSPRLFPVWLDAIRAAGHKFERALWFYDETDMTFPWRGWLMTSQIAILSSIGNPKWPEKKIYHHDCYMIKTAGKQEGTGGHTTAKPLDVIQDLIGHIIGDIFDPFLGSGTSLIACENLKRRCFGIEISPSYIAVCLERMSQAFPGIDIKRI